MSRDQIIQKVTWIISLSRGLFRTANHDHKTSLSNSFFLLGIGHVRKMAPNMPTRVPFPSPITRVWRELKIVGHWSMMTLNYWMMVESSDWGDFWA